MSKKRKLDIRLIVGLPAGPQSGVWRIWSSNSEVYVTDPNSGGVSKLSFHSERKNKRLCQRAFTTEHGTPAGLPNRFTHRWERDGAPAQGLGQFTKVLEVCFPTNFLSTVYKQINKPITWVRPTANGMATIIEMIFTRETKEFLVNAMGGDRIVTFTELPTGEAFVITRRDAEFADEGLIIPASHHEHEDIIISASDPYETGRPMRFSVFSNPKDGDYMTVREYGAYKARATSAMMKSGMGTFQRQKGFTRSSGFKQECLEI